MSWLEQPRLCSVWEHRTVRWCTGQGPVRQVGSGELAALGKELTAYGYNSPDCPVCTGLSGEPTIGRANGRLRDLRETRGQANDREGHRTVRCASDSVRCANGSKAANGRLRQIRKEIRTGLCPVVHRTVRCQTTEGKNCLPGLLSTAPSCLGAIKGTPRHMEEVSKHSLSTLDHSHSILAHLFDNLVI
jgi:hypothetical protein